MGDMELTIAEIATIVGGTVEGDGSLQIESVCSLEDARANQITFAADDKHIKALAECEASAAIVAADAAVDGVSLTLIRVPNTQAALAALLGHLVSDELPPVGIDATASISDDANIAPDVRISAFAAVGPRANVGAGTTLLAGAKIGHDTTVGQNCLLCEGAVVRHGCVLGDRVIIGPNSVIGYDGLGFYFEKGKHNKIPHAGNVVIGNDVEIGACACIDRAKFGSTRIGEGTKIDNLVQIAHNVQIGGGCVLASQVGIAGSAKIGNYVVAGGRSGTSDNVSVGDGARIGAVAIVMEDVPDGATYLGTPAGPAQDTLKQWMAAKKLPELLKRVKRLEKRLKELESTEDN